MKSVTATKVPEFAGEKPVAAYKLPVPPSANKLFCNNRKGRHKSKEYQTKSGAVIYRGKVTIADKRRRIECTVMPIPRTEGALPQLLRVTLK